jgi:hypothetical protein
MSCQVLAEKYSQETNIEIPSSVEANTNADIQLKQDFLLKQTHKCINPSTNKITEDCSNYTTSFGTSDLAKNVIEEEGFLHWVNMKGSHCINQVLGKFVPYETSGTGEDKTSIYMDPGETYPEPKSHCTSACNNFTSTSETCFQCIKEVVEDSSLNPVLYSKKGETGTPIQIDLCSEGYKDENTGKTTIDTTLMKEAVGCKTCIGERMTNLTSIDPADTTRVVYNIPEFNNLWGCISGKKASNPLSTAELVYIIVGVVVFLAIVIGLTVYLVKQKRAASILKQNQTTYANSFKNPGIRDYSVQ